MNSCQKQQIHNDQGKQTNLDNQMKLTICNKIRQKITFHIQKSKNTIGTKIIDTVCIHFRTYLVLYKSLEQDKMNKRNPCLQECSIILKKSMYPLTFQKSNKSVCQQKYFHMWLPHQPNTYVSLVLEINFNRSSYESKFST